MTFEDFVASKKWSDDMREIIGSDADFPIGGYVYDDSFWIQEVLSEDEPNGRAWSTIVGNSEWYEFDLSKIERVLWDEFADGEINHPGSPCRSDGRGFCIQCKEPTDEAGRPRVTHATLPLKEWFGSPPQPTFTDDEVRYLVDLLKYERECNEHPLTTAILRKLGVAD